MTSSTNARRGRRLVAGLATAGLAIGALALTAPSAGAATSVPWTNNPDLGASCGLDVVLMLDSSKSIHTAGAESQVKSAASTLLSAFKDTNTRVGIVTFNAKATKNVGLTYATSSTVAAGGALGAAVAGYTTSTGNGTNWEDGVAKAREEFATGGTRPKVQQLAILVTDGDPNLYNGITTPVNNNVDPNVVDRAVDQTNLIKAAGGHVLTIGVGSNFDVNATSPAIVSTYISYLTELSQYTAVTGAPAPSIAGPITDTNPLTSLPYLAFDPKTTDTLINPNFSDLGAKFAAVAQQVCDASLSLTYQGNSATSPYTTAGLPGWDSSVSVADPIDWVLPASASGSTGPQVSTTNPVGTSVYQWASTTPGWTDAATVTLSTKPNYALSGVSPVTCTTPGGTVTPTVTANSFPITVGHGQINCKVAVRYTGRPQATFTMSPKAVSKTYGATRTPIAGVLTKPGSSRHPAPVVIAGATVKLQASVDGGTTWNTAATLKTGKTGLVSASVAPARNTLYRWSYKSTSTSLLGNVSTTLKFSVPAKVTLAVSKQNVSKGTTVTFSGGVAPSKKYQTVYLQRLVGRTWTTVTSTTLTRKSTYAISWKTDSHTDYQWRVLKKGDALNATAASNVIKLVVK